MRLSLKSLPINGKMSQRSTRSFARLPRFLWRDRGLICYQLDRHTEARIDLENYLQQAPYADDGRIILQLIEEMT
jgi:regulator of sirC expression with transglutaminase-like and TPR domain